MTNTEQAKLTENLTALRLMVRGAYDLQMVRMQVGLRLCANFRSKLTDQEPDDPDEEGGDEKEMSEKAKKLIEQLKASYATLTMAVAKNRTLPDEKNFKGDHLISTFSELVLVDQFTRVEKQEAIHFRQLEKQLSKIPIYNDFLEKQIGVGPAMAAVLISYFDPHKAHHISGFWSYCGVDVAPDGAGRSRRQEHLVRRTYKNKDGDDATRMGVTFNPWVKTKVVGVLGSSFLRSGSSWRKTYDDYKHRLMTDERREKVTVGEWKKRRLALIKQHGEGSEIVAQEIRKLWPPGRIHNAAVRYMIKMFLAEFWLRWRKLEGLPVTPTYHEAKLGHRHHMQAAE
jgi:hypothetical protein